MTPDLKPYPAYRNSGVPWLGEVPEHWDVRRLRNLLVSVTSGSRGWSNYAADSGPLFIRIGNLTRRSIDLDLTDAVRLALPASVMGETVRTHVEPNDILLSITAFIGSIALVPEDIGEAYVSQHVACCRLATDAANARWVAYVLLSPIGQTHGTLCMYGGTKQGLSLDDVKNHLIILPPREEQDTIVRFLDHADRRIRRYIRAKQKLIALLEEQKQAIIHRAVTRGLDPNVRLKPSGVEWLGEVPEHWEVVPLKRVGTVRIGLTYSPGDVCDESGTLVLRASNIRNGQLVRADDVYVAGEVPRDVRVRENDILVCVRSGSRNLVGKSALITREFEGVSYGAFMSLLKTIDNRFYYRVLNSNLLPTVMAQFETSTINQLTQNDLRCLGVPVPPEAERAVITGFLDAEPAM